MTALLAHYEAFVLKNVSTISSLESSLRSVTWFLPGRFKDAELASEALTSMLNVMSMYHDTLVAKIVQNGRNYRPLIPPSPHTRYTRAWSDKNGVYNWASRALQLIKFLELVVEMSLRRKVSSKARWRGVVLLEIMKAILRLLLLKITRKPLLSPPIPERDLDITMSLTPPNTTSPQGITPSPSNESTAGIPEHIKNNHIPLPRHALLSSASETTAEEFLLSKVIPVSSVRPALSLVQSLTSPQDWLAETIYILRPLVYVSLLLSDRRSKRPIVVALLLELLSRNLRRTPSPSATLERTEYARRDRDMLWYLFRGSVWQSYTRPKFEALASQASQAPLFGLLGAFLQDWIPLIDEYYYYTAP